MRRSVSYTRWCNFRLSMYQRCNPVITSRQAVERPLPPLQIAWILTLTLIGFAVIPKSWAACNGPREMTSRVKAKPNAQAHAELANWFADKRDFECAAQSFARAAALQPESLTFQYLWGLSLHSASRDNEALAPLKRAEELDSGDIRPHLALGATLDTLKRINEAEEEWRKALAIDADSAPALDALSQDQIKQKDYIGVVALLGKPRINRRRTPQQNLNLGIAYARSAQLEEAVKVLREGLNDTPDSLANANELAIVLTLLSRNDEAFAVYELALKYHPDDLSTQIMYLRTLILSHSDQAPMRAQRLLADHPNEWEVLYLNGLIASNEGEFEKAQKLVARCIDLHPDSPESQQLLGSTLARMGDNLGARTHLEKAIALGATTPESHYELARVLQRLGDFDHARVQMQQFQKIKYAQSETSQAAGKAEEADQAMSSGDTALAVKLYRDALSSDPDEPLLHYKLAKALEKTHDLAGEKKALARAIELNPNLAEAQNQMGYLAAREGDTAQAETRFRAAIQASPSYTAAWINLGALLASEARWHEARQAANHAREIDQDNAQARRLIDKLNEAHAEP